MAAGASFLTFEECEPVGATRQWLSVAYLRGWWGGVEPMDELLARGKCYSLGIDGRQVGAYLLEVAGKEVFILAAAGHAEIDLCAALDQVVSFQAAGFDSVAFRTVRPGLMKKAAALGYTRHGNVMRKRIAR